MDGDTEVTEEDGTEETEEGADRLVEWIACGRGPCVARGAQFLVEMFMAQFSWVRAPTVRDQAFRMPEGDTGDLTQVRCLTGRKKAVPTASFARVLVEASCFRAPRAVRGLR